MSDEKDLYQFEFDDDTLLPEEEFTFRIGKPGLPEKVERQRDNGTTVIKDQLIFPMTVIEDEEFSGVDVRYYVDVSRDERSNCHKLWKAAFGEGVPKKPQMLDLVGQVVRASIVHKKDKNGTPRARINPATLRAKSTRPRLKTEAEPAAVGS
jgi:hypothetical protein